MIFTARSPSSPAAARGWAAPAARGLPPSRHVSCRSVSRTSSSATDAQPPWPELGFEFEAMACGCVPVVTERGALPEVVGDTGYYVPYGSAVAAAEAIEKALSSKRWLEARKRVEVKFGLKRREENLSSLLRSLIREPV